MPFGPYTFSNSLMGLSCIGDTGREVRIKTELDGGCFESPKKEFARLGQRAI
jgi:hypothetical protein